MTPHGISFRAQLLRKRLRRFFLGDPAEQEALIARYARMTIQGLLLYVTRPEETPMTLKVNGKTYELQ